MNSSIVAVVAFVTVAVVAGLMLWSRRRRSADDPPASLREEIPLAARREPGTEVRGSRDDGDHNAAPEAESHTGSAPDRASQVPTEDGKGILPPPALTAREEGAAEPELPGGVTTADVMETEAPPQDAGLPPAVPVIAAAETDTHSIESSTRATAAKTHNLQEAVAVATTGALPETGLPVAPPHSIMTAEEEPIDSDLRTEQAPTAADAEAQLLPATGDGLEICAQPEVRQAHGGEEQTIEPGSSPAAEVIAVISEDARANQELPADLPYVGMEQSAAPIPVPNPGLEAGQADLQDGEAAAADPHDQSDRVSQESESAAAIEGLNDSPDAVEAVVDEIEAPPPVSGDAASLAADGAETTPPAAPQRRPRAYRDRRGSRRAGLSGARPSRAARSSGGTAPAEAFLRLSLHPMQRTVRLSLVLARPEGFPEHITLATEGHPSVHAYDDGRYDDIDVPASATLLGGELRFSSVERFQWLRSARRVQVFSTTPSEPDLISVSAARAGAEHAVLCRHADVAEVRRIAELAGSPPLVSHDGWPGVPAGCAVLSAYCPIRALTAGIEPSLSPLDPGASITIELSGLAIRARVFAERHPPLITIAGLPEGTVVSIGGENAEQSESGAWVAPGSEAPGRHVIDVVPGPSLTYEIAPDPAFGAGWSFWDAHAGRFGSSAVSPWERAEICGAQVAGPSLTYEIAPDPAFGAGWPFWDAHAGRFGSSAASPWERAEICGAQVVGPFGSVIIAADTHTTMVALGTHATAAPLRHRTDAPVSVGAVRGGAVFLLSAWGVRRNQGRVVWLGNPVSARTLASSRPDRFWIETVRNAASRRLPLEGADEVGRKAWNEAVARARKLARASR